MIAKLRVFSNIVFKENKFSLKIVRLLFMALIYFLKAFLKRERNVASEIFSYESLFFIKKKDPIHFLESCRKNDNAFAPGIREEVIKLKRVNLEGCGKK